MSKRIEVSEEPGCYVDQSAGRVETLNKRVIEFAVAQGMVEPVIPVTQIADEDFRADVDNETADDAVSWLNDHNATPFSYWTIDDNSLFLVANVEEARESVDFVSRAIVDDDTDPEDASYPVKSYRGKWLHVSDHGNATLYVRGNDGKDREIWSVV